MRRQLCYVKLDGLAAVYLSDNVIGQSGSLSLPHYRPAPEIRQGKCSLAVASEICSQKRKQGRVLGYSHNLALAKCSPSWRKVVGYQYQLSQIEFSHILTSPFKCAGSPGIGPPGKLNSSKGKYLPGKL